MLNFKIFSSFIIILLTSVLTVFSQKQNANLNATYRSVKTYNFDESIDDWVVISAPVSNIEFNYMDSVITLNDTLYKIISVKKKTKKKDSSMRYLFVLKNTADEFVDAEFVENWYDDNRYDAQFIINDRAFDIK